MKKKMNTRILKKIEDSDLDTPIKELLVDIMEFESQWVKGSSYSEYYRKKIEKAIAIRRT
ncbi:MAG: hypothetical protein ABSD81_09205 [Methanomicrobiales archaeon]